jgi:hypothetical protein
MHFSLQISIIRGFIFEPTITVFTRKYHYELLHIKFSLKAQKFTLTKISIVKIPGLT